MNWWQRLFTKPEPPKEPEDTSLSSLLAHDLRAVLAYSPPIPLLKATVRICLELEQYPDYQKGAAVAALETFASIFRKLPRAYCITWQELQEKIDNPETGMTVPLYDVIDPGRAILDIVGPFCYGRLVEHGILASLRKQLFENEASVHGISVYERRKKKLPLPHEMNEVRDEPAKMCRKFLRDTPFRDFFNTPISFTIPRDLFASHVFICAPPRHGKTQLLGSITARFLQDEDPPGMCILDPHGDYFTKIKERVAPHRLVVLDPETDPPPLNFLDFSIGNTAFQSFAYLIASLSGGLSDKQAGVAPYLFALLREMPSPTLDTLRKIVEDPSKTAEKSNLWPYIQKLQPRAQDFFKTLFFTGMKETRQAISWKIYAAMGSDAFAKMFSSTTNSFDAFKCMQERKVVIARGSENTLGEDGLPIFLQYIVSQCLMAALRRASIPENQRHLCLLIVDEAKHVFNSQTERILTECRKYNLGYIAATQVLSQIPEDVRSAIYGATAIKIAGGSLQSTDADKLGREMFTSGDFIRSMQPVSGSHADWAIYVQEITPGRAAKVRVPYGTLEAMPKLQRSTEAAPLLAPEQTQVTSSTPRTGPPKSSQITTDLDANARIDKALRLLTSALRPLIEQELRRIHGIAWRQNISIATGSDPNQALDPYAALKTMLDNWQSCFKNIFKIKTRTDASKALEARNAISHASGEIPSPDAISYLTAIRDIGIAISADLVTNTVNAFIEDQIKAAVAATNQQTHEGPSKPAPQTAPTPADDPVVKPGKEWE